MRIVSVGGGPAGLYFAILMKQADPGHDVTVLERNRADDTFGFGVVFSDATLGTFAAADPEPRRDPGPLRPLGRHRHPLSRPGHHLDRPRLLRHVAPGAARHLAGARARARRRAALPAEIGDDDLARLRRDADLVVAADGVNSRCARARRRASRPTSTRAPTASSGSARPSRSAPSPSTSSRPTAGLFRVHAYRYAPEHSTFIVECTEETFAPHRPRRDRRGRHDRLLRAALRRRARRAPAAHEPLASGAASPPCAATAGATRTWCCSATRRTPRTSRSARAPSSRWRTRSRWRAALDQAPRPSPRRSPPTRRRTGPAVESAAARGAGEPRVVRGHRALLRQARAAAVRLQPADALACASRTRT